jgi:hypothetical protein
VDIADSVGVGEPDDDTGVALGVVRDRDGRRGRHMLPQVVRRKAARGEVGAAIDGELE